MQVQRGKPTDREDLQRHMAGIEDSAGPEVEQVKREEERKAPWQTVERAAGEVRSLTFLCKVNLRERQASQEGLEREVAPTNERRRKKSERRRSPKSEKNGLSVEGFLLTWICV